MTLAGKKSWQAEESQLNEAKHLPQPEAFNEGTPKSKETTHVHEERGGSEKQQNQLQGQDTTEHLFPDPTRVFAHPGHPLLLLLSTWAHEGESYSPPPPQGPICESQGFLVSASALRTQEHSPCLQSDWLTWRTWSPLVRPSIHRQARSPNKSSTAQKSAL